jgi:nucleoside-diphosphate-sugar epimerase
LKLLITGADGFTGQHLCDRAAAHGYEVFKLKADLLDPEGLQDEIISVKPDLISHLAAISFVDSLDKASFYSVNVIGTTNLLDAVLKLPKQPLKVLISSSANIYGNSKINPIDETVAPSPTNHYASSKLAMEKMAFTYSDKIPIVISRPFNYTGIGQSNVFIIPKLIEHYVNKKTTVAMGNIDIEREFNDVGFVCDSYLNLLKYGIEGEVYNVCSGKAYSLQKIIDTLGLLTGHLIKVETDTKFIRKNDIKTLYGDPKKLNDLNKDNSNPIEIISIESILSSMLNSNVY